MLSKMKEKAVEIKEKAKENSSKIIGGIVIGMGAIGAVALGIIALSRGDFEDISEDEFIEVEKYEIEDEDDSSDEEDDDEEEDED